MKEILTTLTKKGQVTIPIEIRNYLGLKSKDKIAFKINNGNVQVSPAKYTLESVYGIIKPLNKPEGYKELKKIALDEHAQKVIEEMKK